ncbi:hypothetical protein GCM10023263_58040 [Phytohabitans rumicis]
MERSWASFSHRAARESASSLRATSHLPGGLKTYCHNTNRCYDDSNLRNTLVTDS